MKLYIILNALKALKNKLIKKANNRFKNQSLNWKLEEI